MNARQLTAALKGSAKALALAAALAAHAHAARAASGGQTPQQETPPPRRPQGPVVGPAIKLPPGAGVANEPAQSAAARDEPAREPRRWEYCVIGGFRYHQKGLSLSSSARTPAAVVRYFPNGSEEIEGASEEEALANAFAKLGEDGWELAGVRTDLKLREGDGETSTTYFFKRPKRQE
jgi:hypothetical protein